MFSGTTAIVTGGNRGLGFAVVKGLLNESQVKNIILTARKISDGVEAIKDIPESDRQRIKVHKLDITSLSSIETFKDDIQRKFETFDILVNNAGIAPEIEGQTAETLTKAMETNFFGTAALTKALFPLSSKNSRIVFVSSILSMRTTFQLIPTKPKNAEMKSIGEDLFSVMVASKYLTLERLDQIGKKFIQDHTQGNFEDAGWPSRTDTPCPGYDMSKLLMNGLARVYSKMAKTVPGKQILVNSCCPGGCNTDMIAKFRPYMKELPKSADEGVLNILFLALLPDNAKRPNGVFITEA